MMKLTLPPKHIGKTGDRNPSDPAAPLRACMRHDFAWIGANLY